MQNCKVTRSASSNFTPTSVSTMSTVMDQVVAVCRLDQVLVVFLFCQKKKKKEDE